MANSNSVGDYKNYATVDTAPGATGFWTNELDMRGKKIAYCFFSIRGTGTATVVLQFKCEGDADWTDYYNGGNAFNKGERIIVEGNAGNVLWRAGVKSGGYTTGSVTFGFDW